LARLVSASTPSPPCLRPPLRWRMTANGGQAEPSRSPDWEGLETVLAELNCRVSALRNSWPATAPPQVCTQVPSVPAVTSPALERPPPPAPPPAPPPQPVNQPLQKVPSVFASAGDREQKLLSSLYGLNIFAWEKNGGDGVENDVSALQLRCAARLRARERELKQRDLNGIREIQRAEMKDADNFLEAFDRQEFGIESPHYRHPARRRSGGGAGPLPSAGPAMAWPDPLGSLLPARRGPEAYLDELLVANPEGCAAAVRSLSASGRAPTSFSGQQRRSGRPAYRVPLY